MSNLGHKYTCYSCHTKFYDLGKPEPLCPKCGADQRQADEKPLYTSPRSKRAAAVVEVPAVDDEFESEDVVARPEVADDDEELIVGREEEVEDDVDEEEEI